MCARGSVSSSYQNGSTVIEELQPDPAPQPAKPKGKGKENHAAMHTYDHSKAKWDSFSSDEPQPAPSSSKPASRSRPTSSNGLDSGFLKPRETLRKAAPTQLPPVRQPPAAASSAEAHKDAGNQLFRKGQHDKAIEAYTRCLPRLWCAQRLWKPCIARRRADPCPKQGFSRHTRC